MPPTQIPITNTDNRVTSNYYLTTTGTGECLISATGTGWSNDGGIMYSVPGDFVSFKYEFVPDKGCISPELYFTFIKKKFGLLERPRLEKRLKRIEAAFDKAVDNGQNMLAEKILNNLVIETRESPIYAKGFIHFIERRDLYKFKNQIKGGHIADTMLKDYTRIIPKDVLAKIKKAKDVFDDFVIFHYYEKAVEEKLEKKQQMSAEEKNKMRDPVVFGIIKETDKLYFVADWEDEYCDLTFRKIVDVVGREQISKVPQLI